MSKIDFIDMTDQNIVNPDDLFELVNEILLYAGSVGVVCKLNTKQLAAVFLIAGEMILHTGELTGKIQSEEDKNLIRKVVAEDVEYRKKLIKDSGTIEKIQEIIKKGVKEP